MTRLREERGGILVLSAVLIPLFLLLMALVVDVGNWYTHKRQLQNRADAAALAAGVEYGTQVYHCLSGNATEVADAETEISQQARAYAGDPTYVPAAGGGPDGLPDPSASTNTEIAKQANIEVWLNSTNYDGPNGSDGGGPCLPRTVGDDVSNAGGTYGSPLWVDVKVKEKDTASLFGGFGLNLLRNGARARVELRPAKGVSGFVPIGIPDDRIAKARARFINECTGGQLGDLITLKPLASAYQSIPGVSAWGPDDGAGTDKTSPVTVSFTMPAGLTGCPSGQDYVPISVEVRAAGRPDIDLDPPVTCAALASKPQADCWPQTATIRAWATEGDTGGPRSGDTVLVEDVVLSSGTTDCQQDPFYARLTQGATDCTMAASVYLDFDRRYSLGGTYTAELEVAGTEYTLIGPTTTPGNWFASGIRVPLQDPVVPVPVKVDWNWEYKGPGDWQGDDCSQGSGCKQSGTVSVHTVLPTDNGSEYDSLTAVKLTSFAASDEKHTVKLTNDAGGQQTYSGFLRVGLKSTLTLGQFAVLRLRSGQRNYSLVCDPRFPTPSTSNTQAAFYFGCQPPYDRNPLTNNTYWWSNYDPTDAEPECPGSAGWFSGTGSPPGPPYPQSPWLCVHADPGNNGFAVTDGIALKTGNCASPNISGLSADCPGSPAGRYVCTNGIDVPGPGDEVDMNDKRIIKIYILPFNAFNNVPSGNGTDLPVIDFAAFYVTAWKYQNAVDPCPGNDNSLLDDYNRLPANEKPPQIGGYFVKWVDPGGGAVDSNATCNLNTLTICRAVLVR